MKITINDFPLKWVLREKAKYDLSDTFVLYIGNIEFGHAYELDNLKNKKEFTASAITNNFLPVTKTMSRAKKYLLEYAKQFIEDLQTEK